MRLKEALSVIDVLKDGIKVLYLTPGNEYLEVDHATTRELIVKINNRTFSFNTKLIGFRHIFIKDQLRLFSDSGELLVKKYRDIPLYQVESSKIKPGNIILLPPPRANLYKGDPSNQLFSSSIVLVNRVFNSLEDFKKTDTTIFWEQELENAITHFIHGDQIIHALYGDENVLYLNHNDSIKTYIPI